MTKLIALSAAVLASTAWMAQPVQLQQAKAAGAPPPPPPPAPVAPTFDFDEDLPIPSPRIGAASGGQPSLLAQKLAAVPVGKSFIETITVPAEVVGDAERLAAFKAQAKTISNRVSGAIRRFRKDAANANKNFAVRTVSDDKLGYGIRIWREADTATTA